jgi:hypothetical protein
VPRFTDAPLARSALLVEAADDLVADKRQRARFGFSCGENPPTVVAARAASTP